MNRVITIGGVQFDLKLLFVVVFSTIIPMLDHYGHTVTETIAYDRFIFYFILPALIILFIFRQPLADYGFQMGNWRRGLAWTLAVCVLMGIALYFIARTPSMQAYYSDRAQKPAARLIFETGVELFAWEFMWRGFFLFTLAQILGAGPAIMIQAIPFAFMHLGKPEIETLTTIFGGIGFGFIVWQTKSFVYPWLIHWFIASFTLLMSMG